MYIYTSNHLSPMKMIAKPFLNNSTRHVRLNQHSSENPSRLVNIKARKQFRLWKMFEMKRDVSNICMTKHRLSSSKSSLSDISAVHLQFHKYINLGIYQVCSFTSTLILVFTLYQVCLKHKHTNHESHETCHSVTFYFMKKYSKRCCDITTPESMHTKDESTRG